MSKQKSESVIYDSGELRKINVTLGVVSKKYWNSFNYGDLQEHKRFGFNAYNCRSCGCIGEKTLLK